MRKHIQRVSEGVRDVFVPHERNKHVPHAISHAALFSYTTGMIALKAFVLLLPILLPAASLFSSAVTADNIITLTNATRQALGLTQLQANPELTLAATTKAQDMLANQYFSHTSPAGKTPWDFIHGAGYIYDVAGENLAVHYEQAEDVNNAWLASPTHKANIVDPRYTEIGVGVAQGTFEGYPSLMVVQMFGLPHVTTPPPEPTAPVVPETVPPAPEPVAPGAPVVDLATATVVPTPTNVAVTVEAEDATHVNAVLGTTSVPLTKADDSNVWSGSVPTASTPTTAETLSVVAQNDKATTVEPLATYIPATDARSVFLLSVPTPEFKLFGLLTVSGLEDNVRKIYLATMVFVGMCLLVYATAYVERRRHSIIAHAALVMSIALLLWLA